MMMELDEGFADDEGIKTPKFGQVDKDIADALGEVNVKTGEIPHEHSLMVRHYTAFGSTYLYNVLSGEMVDLKGDSELFYADSGYGYVEMKTVLAQVPMCSSSPAMGGPAVQWVNDIMNTSVHQGEQVIGDDDEADLWLFDKRTGAHTPRASSCEVRAPYALQLDVMFNGSVQKWTTYCKIWEYFVPKAQGEFWYFELCYVQQAYALP
jgi:hypothetical protein